MAVNALLLVRALAETTAVVLITLTMIDAVHPRSLAALMTVLVMVAVAYLLVGVAPRTLGRQHAESYALAVARPVALALGPSRAAHPAAHRLRQRHDAGSRVP